MGAGSIAGMRCLWQMKHTEIACYNTVSSNDFMECRRS